MDSYIQVVSFLLSFIHGAIFYLLTRFNNYILENKHKFFKFLVTLVFIVDIVILYVYLMYKINSGNFHIYFSIVVVLGFISMHKFYDKLKMICQKCVNKIKK